MADVDTSAEAVERLAVSADEVWADFLYLMGRASTEGHAAGQRLACEARIKLQYTAATLRALRAERDALLAFKAYTHQRLDEAGIPTHPEGAHSAEGCRVGDRFDILIAERDAARRLAVAGDDLLRECRAVLEPLIAERDTAQADARRTREALTEQGKLIADFFAPWGAWKTAWWEMQVSDDKPFSAENLLREMQKRIKAALAQGGAE